MITQLELEEKGTCGGLPKDEMDLFFSSSVKAKQVCARCPVREECLEYALQTKQRFGVWGGVGETQRARMLRERKKPAKSVRKPPKPPKPRASKAKQPQAEVALVDGTGAMRRLQALAVLGHAIAKVSKECGVGEATLHKIRIGARPRVSPQVDGAIREVYPRLVATPVKKFAGKSQRAAFEQGWRGPKAWTAESIDDPAAVPVRVANPTRKTLARSNI